MSYRRYKRKSSRMIAAAVSTAIAIAALIIIISVVGDPAGSRRVASGGASSAGSQETTQSVSPNTEETAKTETASEDSEKETQESSETYETAKPTEETETVGNEEMTNPKNLQEAIETERNADKRVYLSFDDGPSIHTERILDILKENGIKATFFNLKPNQSDLLEYEKRTYEEGHTIAIHTVSHDYEKVYSSFDAWKDDVLGEQESIKDNIGITTMYYRFPGGSSNSKGKLYGTDIAECVDWLNDNGFTYVDWNVSNNDADGNTYTASELVENVVSTIEAMEEKGTTDSYMVLMHDAKPKSTTVEALPTLISTLRKKGFTFCQLTDNTPEFHHNLYKGE